MPGDDEREQLETEDVYEAMEPLEPYTTGELAGLLERSKRVVRDVLERLASNGEVRKKEPESSRAIWIREPPRHECPNCGHEFEVRYLHPVLSAVQFCPRCGTHL